MFGNANYNVRLEELNSVGCKRLVASYMPTVPTASAHASPSDVEIICHSSCSNLTIVTYSALNLANNNLIKSSYCSC